MVTLANGHEARYFLSVDAILSIEHGARVQAGDVLARIPKESSKTRDITGGLPRVAELFEARKPKDFAVIAESEGRVEFGRDYKTKRRVRVVASVGADGDAGVPDPESTDYLIPKGRHIAVREGDYVKVGDLLVDGNPVPHDILRILGVEELAAYLIKEIQDVYRLQGVKINDKHIEVIVRQMLQKVEIEDSGDTTLLVGELIDRDEFEEINRRAEDDGERPATAKPVLQGITKASLQTKSFISAASFQETTRVLTEAAVSGRVDGLDGLKENVHCRTLGAGRNRQRDEPLQAHCRRTRPRPGPGTDRSRPGAAQTTAKRWWPVCRLPSKCPIVVRMPAQAGFRITPCHVPVDRKSFPRIQA